MLTFLNADDSVSASLQFNSDLFDESTIKRMIGHFLTLLSGITDDPSSRLGELPLLNPGEQQLLLKNCNETAADFPRGSCLHQLFEAQAQPNTGGDRR